MNSARTTAASSRFASPFAMGLAESDVGRAETRRSWMLESGEVTGDFNDNGDLDANDVDLLSDQIKAATNDDAFDLTGDGQG